MMEGLSTIERISLVDLAERKLLDCLGSEGFQCGDTLPREDELSAMLGVSRAVVREAISRLRMLGMLECRRRRGTIIVRPDMAANLNRMLHPALLDTRAAREIMEIRLSLEIGMAELLFARKKDADIRELRAIHAHRTKNPAHLEYDVAHEARFHGKLFAITGNPLLRGLYDLVPQFFQAAAHLGLPLPLGDALDGRPGHESLIDVLERGTPDVFRECMSRHLAPYFAALIRAGQAGAERKTP